MENSDDEDQYNYDNNSEDDDNQQNFGRSDMFSHLNADTLPIISYQTNCIFAGETISFDVIGEEFLEKTFRENFLEI